MKTINNQNALEEYMSGNAVIIDVREPMEFKEIHIPGAINIPSTHFDIQAIEPFKDRKICLVCQTGKRTQIIIQDLEEKGWSNIYSLEKQMQSYAHNVAQKDTGWTVDRQFRMTLGVLLALFLIMFFLGYTGFIVIPIILSAGLTITAIIDKCYMRTGIAKLPWNKGKQS
jgi:rhodanese-related sulfurtransferase